METVDLLVGLTLIFVILFVAITSMRVTYNAAKGEKAPLGIRVSQWITFIGVVMCIIIILCI